MACPYSDQRALREAEVGAIRVDVVLPIPVNSTFTYLIEGPAPSAGTRVLVPFRREERIGWVVGRGTGAGVAKLRTVLDVLEEEPSVSPELMGLSRWISDYYLAPLGMVLKTSLPSVLSDSSREYLSALCAPGENVTRREQRLLDALLEAGTPRRVKTLRKTLAMGSIWPEIRTLSARGFLRHETLPPKDPPIQTKRVVRVERW